MSQHISRSLPAPLDSIHAKVPLQANMEGIEYSWGAAKRYCRRAPLSLKRSSYDFEELVNTLVT